MAATMSEAIWVETGESLLASKVWTIGRDADKKEWKCPECSVAVVPVAWRPPSWRKDIPHQVPAHFRLKPDEKHASSCSIGQLSEPTLPGSETKSENEPSVVSAADVLLVVTFGDHVEKSPERNTTSLSNLAGAASGSQAAGQPAIQRMRRLQSIEDLCVMHYASKNDIRALAAVRISVEGCDGETLHDVFRGVPNTNYPKQIDCRRILFQSLRFTRNLTFDSNSLHVALNSGSPSPKERPFEVHIQFDGWLPEDRDIFSWFTEVHRSFRSQYGAGDHVDAQFYFIGEQDQLNPMTFVVRDPRKIALIYPHSQSQSSTGTGRSDAQERSEGPKVLVRRADAASKANPLPAEHKLVNRTGSPLIPTIAEANRRLAPNGRYQADAEVKSEGTISQCPGTVEHGVPYTEPQRPKPPFLRRLLDRFARVFQRF